MEKEPENWWKKALYNLVKAKGNFKMEFFDEAALLCQQSVEIGLKALLIGKTSTFPKIHDLTNLAKLADAPENIIKLCSKLNPAYITARYPDPPKDYTKEESKELIKYCKEVLSWIQKNLSS